MKLNYFYPYLTSGEKQKTKQAEGFNVFQTPFNFPCPIYCLMRML